MVTRLEQVRQNSTEDRNAQLRKQYPQFVPYWDAIDILEKRSRIRDPHTRNTLFAHVSLRDHPDQADAISNITGIPLFVVRSMPQDIYTPDQHALDRILKDELRKARSELFQVINQRPAVLQDEEEIRARILERTPIIPGKYGPKPGNQQHVSKLSIVRRLRNRGFTNVQIPTLSRIKSLATVGNLAKELLDLKLLYPIPFAYQTQDETKELIEWVKKERLAHPNITYRDMAKKRNKETGKRPSLRQIKHAIEKGDNTIPRKKRTLQETFDLIQLYLEDHEATKLGKPLAIRNLAAFLGVHVDTCYGLKKKFNNRMAETAG